jgi:hypothetical protein
LGRDRLRDKRPHEPVDVFQPRLGGGLYFFLNPPDPQQIPSDQAYQKIGNRLGCCIEASFPGYGCVSAKTHVFWRKTPLFVTPISAAKAH